VKIEPKWKRERRIKQLPTKKATEYLLTDNSEVQNEDIQKHIKSLNWYLFSYIPIIL
jgi:hypothetical protein